MYVARDTDGGASSAVEEKDGCARGGETSSSPSARVLTGVCHHSLGEVDTAHGALRSQTTATRTEAACAQHCSLDDEELPAEGQRPAAWEGGATHRERHGVHAHVQILDVLVPQM